MVKKILGAVLIVGGIVCFATFARSQSDKVAPVKAEIQIPAAVDEVVDPLSEDAISVDDLSVIEEPIPAAVAEDKKEASSKDDDLYSQVELFSYALTTIQSEYVEEKKPKDIIYGALTGMLSSLDPHSQFLTPEDYTELKTETEGKFGGLGIEISTRDGLLTVVTPIDDTPAWKAGIKSGDRIVKIEKDLTKEMTLNDAVKKLRGVPGTKVHITVLRESEYKIHEFDITREIIHVQDIKDPHVIEEGIAYLRLVEFREDSTQQFYKALKKLKDEGATSLVLDLRNNPGGLLNVAIAISEIFLPEGMTIVSTKGRHANQNSISVSHNKKNEFGEWPIVVLINEGSASGSEILAGALKDNKRAVTLGAKSFGKGSVQSVIPLPDGSGLRLTTSKYFTPSGTCIHEIGITPDIVIERVYSKDQEEEALEGDEVKDSDKKVVKKDRKDVEKVFDKLEEDDISDPVEIEKRRREASLKKKMSADNQIQSAISVIKGIRVYKKLQNEITNVPQNG